MYLPNLTARFSEHDHLAMFGEIGRRSLDTFLVDAYIDDYGFSQCLMCCRAGTVLNKKVVPFTNASAAN